MSEVKSTRWPGTAPPLWPRKAEKKRNWEKKIQKTNKQKKRPHTKAATLHSKWAAFSLLSRSFNFISNNKSQTERKVAQIIEPGTFPKWKKLLHPKSHTEPMNQTNQPGEPPVCRCSSAISWMHTGKASRSRALIKIAFICLHADFSFFWGVGGLFDEFQVDSPACINPGGFYGGAQTHRHTHTHLHTQPGVWTHLQPDQEQDSKTSRSNTLLLMTCCRGWRLTLPDCIRPKFFFFLKRKKHHPHTRWN